MIMKLLGHHRSSAVRLSLQSGAVLAISLLAAPVLFAQDTVVQGKSKRTDVVEQRVTYYDLDLTETQGQRLLVSRVRHAANNVCDIVYSGQSPIMKFESGCQQKAFRDAKPQINLAIASAQNGTRVAIRLTAGRSH